MRNGYHHDRNGGMGVALPLIGLGVVAGWFLRRALQQKYEGMQPNGKALTAGVSDREMIETVFGEYTHQLRDTYQDVRQELESQLDEMKSSLQEIDITKYREMVREAVENRSLSPEQMKQLRTHLEEDFQHVRKTARKPVRKAAQTRGRRANQDSRE